MHVQKSKKRFGKSLIFVLEKIKIIIFSYCFALLTAAGGPIKTNSVPTKSIFAPATRANLSFVVPEKKIF